MTVRILQGDARDVLATMPVNSVHCVITSPPYYGLRDYGTAQWDGGDAGCDHTGVRRNHSDEKQATSAGTSRDPVSRECRLCGARRIDRQMGLEASPSEYIQGMVEVFREVRRVLRDDGTLWLNIGDSMSSGGNGPGSGKQLTNVGANMPPKRTEGLAAKQLLMMPARLALALQADGWWLRSDIIWAKPNPMPESVTDRPTSAHEHVFLLTRSARYYYDADAVREEASENTHAGYSSNGAKTLANTDAFGVKPSRFDGYRPPNRNLRNVWSIATEAFPEAHFATYPTALVERCIKAGTSERGCCAACGAPWVRMQERTAPDGRSVVVPAGQRHAYSEDGEPLMPDNRIDIGTRAAFNAASGVLQRTTTGWRASCTCDAPTVPATVLDPFAGAGTTLLVADRLQRHGIGIELNPAYAAMARNRITRDAGLFAEVAD